MPLPTWKNEYSVGVQSVDEQHQNLIVMIRDLHTAMVEGHGEEEVGNIMNRLVRYTEYHFSAEEAYMEEIGYPELERHRDQHALLTGEVFEVFRDIQEGRRDMAEDVFSFLNTWLIDHIAGSDLKIKAYLETRNATDP